MIRCWMLASAGFLVLLAAPAARAAEQADAAEEAETRTGAAFSIGLGLHNYSTPAGTKLHLDNVQASFDYELIRFQPKLALVGTWQGVYTWFGRIGFSDPQGTVQTLALLMRFDDLRKPMRYHAGLGIGVLVSGRPGVKPLPDTTLASVLGGPALILQADYVPSPVGSGVRGQISFHQLGQLTIIQLNLGYLYAF